MGNLYPLGALPVAAAVIDPASLTVAGAAVMTAIATVAIAFFTGTTRSLLKLERERRQAEKEAAQFDRVRVYAQLSRLAIQLGVISHSLRTGIGQWDDSEGTDPEQSSNYAVAYRRHVDNLIIRGQLRIAEMRRNLERLPPLADAPKAQGAIDAAIMYLDTFGSKANTYVNIPQPAPTEQIIHLLRLLERDVAAAERLAEEAAHALPPVEAGTRQDFSDYDGAFKDSVAAIEDIEHLPSVADE